MNIPLRVLIVEDSKNDAWLMVQQLEHGGYAVTFDRVDSAAAMSSALDQRSWDIVIADYAMPGFDGLAALGLCQAKDLDLPFILVSGTIGEDVAVRAMKAGAHDYIMKGNLARLASAVERELREAKIGRERRQFEAELCRTRDELEMRVQARTADLARANAALQAEIAERKALENMWKRYAFIANTSKEFMTLINRQRTYEAVNDAYCQAHDKPRDEILGKTVADVWGAERYAAHVKDNLDRCFAGQEVHYQAWFEFAALGARHLDVAYYPYWAEGVATHVVVVSHDDTEHRQTEEALDRERRLLRTVIDNVPDQIFARDADCRFILSNRSDAQTMGVADPESLLGKTDYDFCPPELAARYQADNRQVMATGQPLINREEPLSALDGHGQRWGLTTKVPLRDSHGQVIGVVGIARDITDRKRMEEVLRTSEEHYRALVETSPDAITLTDLNGHFIMANRRAAEMHRFACVEDLLGVSASDLIAPEDRSRASEAILKALTIGYARNLEYTFLRKDGTRFPVEVSASTVTDATGRPQALMGATRDITERRRTEEALKTAHAQTQLLLASISSILIGVGPDDRITHWNAPAEAAFGLTAAEMIGQPIDDQRIPWDSGEVSRRFFHGRNENQPTRLADVRYTRPAGKEGFLNITLSPFIGDEPGQPGFLLLGEEITERRILEMQLVQAQKLEAIGQLAAGIAHEINTPIQYVGDNTRFLQESFFEITALFDQYRGILEAAKVGGVRADQLVELASVEAATDWDYLSKEIPRAIYESLGGIARVAEIVRAMREFSHPDIVEKVATDLNRAIENTITVTRNEWKYVAEVQTELDPDLPRVPCLPGEFNQVILNLLVNAAQAIADVVGDGSNGKGTIAVTTRRTGSWAEIHIRDTGTGIPEKARGRIFDPFFTTKEVGKGTGQGLAIAYNVIVEKHGGTITFETELGMGTTFTIRLPLAADLPIGDRNALTA